MPEFRQKKSAEQAEDSSPNPSSSACDIRIQKRISRGFAKSFPQKIVLAKPSPHFAPPHCPNTWRAEPRKKNTLSFFKRNFPPAKSRKQGVFFLSGLPRLCEAVARRFIPRRDWFQKRFEFCTMNTALCVTRRTLRPRRTRLGRGNAAEGQKPYVGSNPPPFAS